MTLKWLVSSAVRHLPGCAAAPYRKRCVVLLRKEAFVHQVGDHMACTQHKYHVAILVQIPRDVKFKSSKGAGYMDVQGCLLHLWSFMQITLRSGIGAFKWYTAFQVEIIMLPKDVGWYHRREVAAVLFLVEPVLNVNHALGIRIALQRADPVSC